MIDTRFFHELKKIKVSELAESCGFVMQGGRDFEISCIATLQNAKQNELSFFGNKKYINELKNTSAGAVIVSENNVKDVPQNTVALVFPNVMLGYAKALEILYPKEKHAEYISKTAVIHSTAKIGSGCYIGDYVVIGENVEIGDNVFIGNHTSVEKGSKIGSNGYIHSNVTISHSIIGNNVIINSGSRLGESGFGIIPTGTSMTYIPQLGRVIIGDSVRIGSNTTIDRGSIGDTTIGNDTIIDNLVQIAHNVTIGNMSIIVSQVGIAGSTKIGNGVILAGQVGVSGHIEIGDGAIAAAKSGIASSLKPGQIVGGIPAVDADIWRRQAAFLKSAVTKKKKTAE